MSHFTVLVALSGDDTTDLADYVQKKLDEVLAPYDENLDVPRYKVYEAPDPHKYWLVESMRKDGQLPEEGEVTWPDIVAGRRKRYPNEGEDEQLFYDVEDDQPAYTWSTYSPKSKWDWWVIGGRWRARLTPALGADPADVLMADDRSYPFPFLDEETKDRKGVNGGRKRALDLQLMREVAYGKACTEWREVMDRLKDEDLTAYASWASLVEKVKDDNDPQGIDTARATYHSQPVCLVMKALYPDQFEVPGAEEFFTLTEEEYGRKAAAAAVPGFAYIDLEGEWHEPGHMGWFAMSTDTDESRAEYHAKVNAAVDELPDDAILVSLDCHI